MNKKISLSVLLTLPISGMCTDGFASATGADFVCAKFPVTAEQEAGRNTVNQTLDNLTQRIEEIIIQAKRATEFKHNKNYAVKTIKIDNEFYTINLYGWLKNQTYSSSMWKNLKAIVGAGFSGETLRSNFFDKLDKLQTEYQHSFVLACCVRDIKKALAQNPHETRHIIGNRENAEKIKTLAEAYAKAFNWNFSYAPATTLHDQTTI